MLLFIIGLVILAISAIKDARKLMACTIFGYIGGFAAGILFSVDGVDEGGGAANNWWQIWAIAYIAIIIVGVLWEILSKRAKNKKVR
jgi:NADH:ubiquinone oxidoreductase subunit 6 (subunit J)